MASLFETETCRRCGGTGRHSYNQMDGDRCYGCGGRGTRLTKRGSAAQGHYRASFPFKVALDLLVGDTFRLRGVNDSWATVTAVGPVQPNAASSTLGGMTTFHDYITIERHFGGKFSSIGVASDSVVLIRPGIEGLRRLQTAALEYQASLTKQGKARKGKGA